MDCGRRKKVMRVNRVKRRTTHRGLVIAPDSKENLVTLTTKKVNVRENR